MSADILRRTGKFEKANDLIHRGLVSDIEGFILDLPKAEKVLVEQKNDLCYSMEDELKLVDKA